MALVCGKEVNDLHESVCGHNCWRRARARHPPRAEQLRCARGSGSGFIAAFSIGFRQPHTPDRPWFIPQVLCRINTYILSSKRLS